MPAIKRRFRVWHGAPNESETTIILSKIPGLNTRMHDYGSNTRDAIAVHSSQSHMEWSVGYDFPTELMA